MDTIAGEQQLKRTQSGSSSRSGRNRGAADTNREQQLKRTQSGGMQADAIGGQANAIGEQQLCTESCPAPDYSR